jgi:hypothetical protein
MPEHHPPRDITISASQLDSMSCRLQWHWSYRKGYRARRRNANLLLGDGVHQALEAYYRDGLHPVDVFVEWAEAQQEELEELSPGYRAEALLSLEQAAQLGIAMLTNYLEHYKEESFDVLAVERTVKVPLPAPDGSDSPYHLVVRLDTLVRDHRSARLFSLEHKTYKRAPDLDQLERDHQFSAQVWAGNFLARELGYDEDLVGVIYNGLRKAERGPRTTAPLFQRHLLFRTEHSVEVFLHRAYWQAHEMNQPKVPIYPQPNPMKCSWCDFADPCKEYISGGDYKSILDVNFTSREQRGSTRWRR